MSDPIVTSRYAEALFARALRHNLLGPLETEARSVLRLTAAQGPNLQAFFDSPRIPRAKKREMIERTLALSEASHLDELVLLMLDKGRLDHFAPVLQQFLALAEQHRGFTPATVTTAFDLDEGQRDALRHTLETHTGHQLELRFHVDPTLLGGVVFRHHDELLDSSLRTSLSEIGGQFAQTRVH